MILFLAWTVIIVPKLIFFGCIGFCIYCIFGCIFPKDPPAVIEPWNVPDISLLPESARMDPVAFNQMQESIKRYQARKITDR